jgi:hypothetical protein
VSADLVIVHLYPDMLLTYGDRGNVLTLRRRAEWRGFTVEVVSVSRGGEPMPPTASLVMVGGGTDRVQEALAPDLLGRGPELREAAARGAVVLGVCGGYQFLGRAYVLPDGREIEGIGVLDVTTRASEDRIIGRVRARADLWGRQFQLVGFENHGGADLAWTAGAWAVKRRDGRWKQRARRHRGSGPGNGRWHLYARARLALEREPRRHVARAGSCSSHGRLTAPTARRPSGGDGPREGAHSSALAPGPGGQPCAMENGPGGRESAKGSSCACMS